MRTYLVSETYEIITSESAEMGDAEESGFNFRDEEMTAREIADYLKDNGFIHPSSSHYQEHVWFSTDSDIDYRTGDETIKSLHFCVPKKLMKAICSCAGIRLIF